MLTCIVNTKLTMRHTTFYLWGLTVVVRGELVLLVEPGFPQGLFCTSSFFEVLVPVTRGLLTGVLLVEFSLTASNACTWKWPFVRCLWEVIVHNFTSLKDDHLTLMYARWSVITSTCITHRTDSRAGVFLQIVPDLIIPSGT